jgi:hypothetical protein
MNPLLEVPLPLAAPTSVAMNGISISLNSLRVENRRNEWMFATRSLCYG